MDKSAALQQFSFYSQSSQAFQAEVESTARWAHLDQGQQFVREGAMCPQFAVLAAGNLRVYKGSRTGREITLYHVRGGQSCLANMLCTFLDIPSPASAVAEQPVDALIVPAPTFRRWIAENEAMRTFMFQSMAGRFIDLMMLIEEVAFQKLDRRLADYLLRSFVKDGFPMRELSATHEAIAMELGSAREVVSRLLKEFERLGAIETARGRIILKNPCVLERIGDDHYEE